LKDHLLQIVAGKPPAARRNIAREYLQLYVLRLLQELGQSVGIALVGGTALRLLHALPRFSEDLAFSTAKPGTPDATALRSGFGALERELDRAGYVVRIKPKETRALVSAMIRFEGVPKDCGFASDPRLALSVKVEIDTRPPDGATLTTTLVQRYFPVALVHHDLPSLFAGKLHALLTRSYPKGRDWYDLVWVLTEQRGLEPNPALLASALRQTGADAELASRWRVAVAERAAMLDWQAVRRDLEPFLERPKDLEQMSLELVARLVRGR